MQNLQEVGENIFDVFLGSLQILKKKDNDNVCEVERFSSFKLLICI